MDDGYDILNEVNKIANEGYDSYHALIDAYFATVDAKKAELEAAKAEVENDLMYSAIFQTDYHVAVPLARDGKEWRVFVETFDEQTQYCGIQTDTIKDATVTTLIPKHHGGYPVAWCVSGAGSLGEYQDVSVWLPDSNDDSFWGIAFENFDDVKEAMKK